MLDRERNENGAMVTCRVGEGNIVHFTHNDSDAIGCAVVVDLYNSLTSHGENVSQFVCFNDIRFFNKNLSEYLDVLEKVIDRKVRFENTDDEMCDKYKHTFLSPDGVTTTPDTLIISDLPLMKENADRLEIIKNNIPIDIVYVDHHVSNTLDKSKYTFDILISHVEDESRESAAVLLWELLIKKINTVFPETIVSEKISSILNGYIRDVSRYDVGKWLSPDHVCRNFDDKCEWYTAAIISQAGNVYNAYKYIRKSINEFLKDDCFENEYNFTLSSDLRMMIKLYSSARDAEIMRSKNKLVNVEACEIGLSEKYSDAKIGMYIGSHAYLYETTYTLCHPEDDDAYDILVVLFPDNCVLSFRHGTNKYDLSVLAKEEFCGGGHKDASGASVDSTTFLQIMSAYYKHRYQ